jgi:hypothetical protein
MPGAVKKPDWADAAGSNAPACRATLLRLLTALNTYR